ncbi:reticulophagy regulator 2-like isoform X1 [Salvelinus namaycush]|uniref:Reticulophagy regulator 2-like isoform X1 n=1 Tax=Salvelinus namaycush TaxID=8040 RepID=A0A8U0R2W7_SALNM|nr:reticulophagy regulator 2-like isoform X1 [Salvelinus namaycush]
MASGEEARCPSVSSVLEDLFPAGGSEQVCGDGNPELVQLRERLQGWLSQYEPLLLWMQRLLVWERPLYSIFVALTLNTLFWLLSSTSLRPLFLLSLSILGLMQLERWKHKLPLTTVQYPEANPMERETMNVQPRLLSIPELSHHLVESYLYCCLFVQEMLQYKRQNHGKFCAMMCSGCSVLAVVGHYVPGIMISYIVALSVLVWPLVVYHELIQRMYTGLEPILMKLDYSMKGDTQHHKHDKRKVKKEVEEGDEPRAETESESEEELSCFAPLVDAKTTALAMAITDSELSDEEASILESGGFSVSRATTPQITDVSEDPDQQSVHNDPEEAFLRDRSEFPSVDEFPIEHSLLYFPLRGPGQSQGDGATAGGREPSEAEPMSPASLLLQHLASPLHFVNTHFNGRGRPPGGDQGPLLGAGTAEEVVHGGEVESQAPRQSLEALSEEIVNTAISTVVQNTLSALLRSTEDSKVPSIADFLPTDMPSSTLESPPVAEAEKDQDAVAVETEERSAEEMPDDMFVPTEDEDFELLDQSELEEMDEDLLGLLSPDGQGIVGVASPTDTPPSPTHQPESF